MSPAMHVSSVRSWLKSMTSRLPPAFRSEWRALILFGVALLLAAWIFYEIVEDMVWNDPLVVADTATYVAFQHLRTPLLDRVMMTVTELGDAVIVWAVALAVAGWLAWRRNWRALGYWITAVGGGSLINTAIKLAMHRARPGDLHYAGASVFSFPSGHSTTNAALYGFLIVLVAREIPMARRVPVVVSAVLFVGLIAISRLYLGAHWLSDVGGGLAFASAWISLLALFYMWRPAGPVEPYKLLLVALGALLIAGATNVTISHRADAARYAIAALHPEERP